MMENTLICNFVAIQMQIGLVILVLEGQLQVTSFNWQDVQSHGKAKGKLAIALSSTEAEYMAMSSAAQEAVWLRRLLLNLGFSQKPTILYEDNQGAIALSKNPKSHSGTKHIDIRYHFIREIIERKEVEPEYCATQNMIADIFTKGLPRPKFEELRHLMGVKA